MQPKRNEYGKKHIQGAVLRERQLDEVRKEIKLEKLEAAKTEAKAALVAKVGSLLGSNKLKAERDEMQQRISALESQNEELIQYIETMEREHI